MNDEQCKILCVDDEPNVLKALRRIFIDENYEIFAADGGEQGLDMLQDNPDIRLVISDFRMPGMDGVQFLKQVNERWPAIVRIVLSGFADTAAVVGAINEGQIYKFIPKPWNDDELRTTVRSALEVYSQRSKNAALASTVKSAGLTLQTDSVSRLSEDFETNQLALHALDHLPFAVVGLDASRNIILTNSRAKELLTHFDRNLSLPEANQDSRSVVQHIVEHCNKDRGSGSPMLLAGLQLYVKMIDASGEPVHQCIILFISEHALP